jgi:hypothetical protein
MMCCENLLPFQALLPSTIILLALVATTTVRYNNRSGKHIRLICKFNDSTYIRNVPLKKIIEHYHANDVISSTVTGASIGLLAYRIHYATVVFIFLVYLGHGIPAATQNLPVNPQSRMDEDPRFISLPGVVWYHYLPKRNYPFPRTVQVSDGYDVSSSQGGWGATLLQSL